MKTMPAAVRFLEEWRANRVTRRHRERRTNSSGQMLPEETGESLGFLEENAAPPRRSSTSAPGTSLE
jgi:hypothetical protein